MGEGHVIKCIFQVPSTCFHESHCNCQLSRAVGCLTNIRSASEKRLGQDLFLLSASTYHQCLRITFSGLSLWSLHFCVLDVEQIRVL
jgi:hypothetical protein